ncbi:MULTISPECIES: hypothetical protein [unclassified Bradyrhizobium]|uniref:hypothetical protein n=1 Tax=unclassified Bradyrhizobium TaxID=2631580 RepID=UPI002FF34E55
MNARDEFRREMDEALTSLAGSIAPKIDQNSRDLLAEFIENFEFGVALEWLHSLTVSKGIQLSSEQEQEIRRLAQRMGLDLG